MRPRRYDLIAFDWDGTLFDSTAAITQAIQAAVGDVGGAVPSKASASYVIGLGLTQALAHAAPDVSPDRYPELAVRYQHHYRRLAKEVTLFDGVLPMLADLKRRHHWLVVATGKSRRGLDEVLTDVALVGVFDGSRTADETAGKPHPLMLHELMREFGAESERTLMIGDTTHDLQMAQAAGCDSVGVSYGAHAGSAFVPFQPKAVVHSVAELHRWLLEEA
jgi:phosphoglycolate phosphatase